MTHPRIDAPTPRDVKELLDFLPALCAEGFQPVNRWHGGVNEEGVITMPYPEYEQVVGRFFRAASKKWWMDKRNQPETAAAMLMDERALLDAVINDIRSMLTYCVRGERFCDGHWAAMIEGGHVCRLLRRLASVSGVDVDTHPHPLG